jgi:asparagine synthetase B (glutamine-hydrolysing)
MVGYLESKHRYVMKDLLYLTALRGKDSTGLTAVHRDRTVATRKMTIPAYEFIEIPAVDRTMQHADQVWMGHCRFKTTGSVSRTNAHPFEVLDEDGDILLVGTHNGTLDNKYEIENIMVGKPRFDTDSEGLFNLLVEAGDFKEAIGKLKGAWSLAWWDPTTDSFHFCRNDKRPLVYAYTKDRKVLIYASEAWMILAACRRNNIELDCNEKGLSCWSTVVDNLYTMKIPQDRDKELPEMVREGGYVGAPAVNFQNDGNKRWVSWWDRERELEEAEKKAKAGKKTTETNAEKTVVHLVEPNALRGFNGSNLSQTEFNRIRNAGCVWHDGPIERDEPFAFIGDTAVVCARCLRDSHTAYVPGDERPSVDYPDIDENEDLDDDLPFTMGSAGAALLQKNSEEFKKIKAKAVEQAKKVVG